MLFSFSRNDPPGQTCQMAIQELTSLSFNAAANAQILCLYIKPVSKSDFQLRIKHRDKLKAKLNNIRCIEISNFEE